jgi:hypothetical protein
MRNVKFPVVYSLPNNSGVIVYPDAIEKFSNVEVIGDFIYAGYSGSLPLEEAANPNRPRRKLSKLEFINLFTDEEYEDILAAAKTSVQVEAWVDKFRMTSVDPDGGSIDLADPRTISGIQALEAAGLIGAGRAAEILAAN